MPIDIRTTNLNLPLPNAANSLIDDVARIISALQLVDTAVAGKATPADVSAAVAALVNSSPATLDTLKELATALGNDANFAATVMSALALKANQNQVVTSINGLTGAITVALISKYPYDSRAILRTLSPVEGDAAIVIGLGLFVWESASTEPDDDESAFATTLGVWLLQAVHWDLVDSWQLPDQQIITDIGEVLSGSATCAITLVGSTNSASFTGTVTGAAVGDRVIATPPAQLGSEGTNTGRLSYHAWVSGADTVTIMLTNASASAASTNILIQAVWPVTVIKT